MGEELRRVGPAGVDVAALIEGVERRTVPMVEVRVLEGPEGEPARIEGYAAVFGAWSEDLGGFREQIAPGAFAKTIQEADVRALFNHDVNYVLGRSQSGTLELREDERGLFFSVVPPGTSWARDLLVTMERGDVNQMSFGFETVRDEWEKGPDDEVWRTLVEVKLFDVSPVTFPAYPQTSAQVRSKVSELTATPPEDGHLAVARARVAVLRRRLELVMLEGSRA